MRMLSLLVLISAVALPAQSQSPTSGEHDAPDGMARFFVYGGDGQIAYFTEHLVARLERKSYLVYDAPPGSGYWYVGYFVRRESEANFYQKAGEKLPVAAEAGHTYYIRLRDHRFEQTPSTVARADLAGLKRTSVPPGVLQIESEIAAESPAFGAKPFPWSVSWSNGCSDPWVVFGECLTQEVSLYFEDDCLNLQLVGLEAAGNRDTGRGVRIKYRDIRDVRRRKMTFVVLTHLDGRVDVLTTPLQTRHLWNSDAADMLAEEIRRRTLQSDAARTGE